MEDAGQGTGDRDEQYPNQAFAEGVSSTLNANLMGYVEPPLQVATRRLREERESGCASPGDIAFWESEVLRLRKSDASNSTEAMYNALKVVITNPGIRSWLMSHDPKALEQAEAATDAHRRVIANDGTCHEKHVEIRIDVNVRDALLAFLQHEAPRGMGYTAFIEWALRVAKKAVAPCADDGSGFCMVHYAPGTTDETFACDGRELVNLA